MTVNIGIFVILSYMTWEVVCHSADPNLLILVSFDGFRYDYLDIVKKANKSTPNFDWLIANGVRVESPGMTNAFNTVTFPNHFTLVTGMYEEKHGIVANNMYDIATNKTFTLANAKDPFWFHNGSLPGESGPEPIWITNQRADDRHRHSGVMFWPGSEVPYGADNMYPYHFYYYNESIPNIERIENVISWFIAKTSPINLGLLYFSEPDHHGHKFGPSSPEVIDVVVAMDGLVGHLVQRLKEEKLFHRTNLIITSDHGMDSVTDYIYVDDYLDSSLYRNFGGGVVWNVLPAEGRKTDVYEKMTGIPHTSVYLKEDIPREYHYTYNKRILPILLVAHQGYILCHSNSACDRENGVHGYNNSLPSMHPIFVAHGPEFKQGFVSPVFNSVDLYPLMCHLLDVEPNDDIDGTMDVVTDMLVEEHEGNLELNFYVFVVTVLFAAFVTGIGCIASCHVYRITRKHNNGKPRIRGLLPVNTAHLEKGSHDHLLGSSDDEL